MDNSRKKKNPYILNILLYLVLGTGIIIYGMGYLDSDLYYMLPTGKYILNHGIPHTNPFITIPNIPIVIQNWLYCVCLAFIEQKWHSFGLFILNTTFVGLMFFTIRKFFSLTTEDKIISSFCSLFIIHLFQYTNIRPEMLTFILIMLEILSLEKYQETKKRLYLWVLPITILLEINFHASYWIMHYVVLLPYIVPLPKVVKQQNTNFTWKEVKEITPFAILSSFMLFINPYGLDNILYVFKALTSDTFKMIAIMEQQPFYLMTYETIYIILFLGVFLYQYQKKALTSTTCYMFVGFAILTFSAVKWIAFFAIGTMYLLRCLFVYLSTRKEEMAENLSVNVEISCCWVPVIALLCGLLLYSKSEPEIFHISDSEYIKNGSNVAGYEELNEFAKWLQVHESRNDVSVMTNLHDSNYFEYYGYRIYYDARPELYSKSFAEIDILSKTKTYETGIDYCAYREALQANAEVDLTEYDMGLQNYGKFINEMNMDYYVCEAERDYTPIMYFKANSERFKLVCKTENFLVFKNVS